jgi:hypothetical protein
MTTRKHARVDAEAAPASTDLASAARREAEAWLDSNAELLREVDVMTRDWVERRRESVDAARQSMEELRTSREITDLMRIQQEWLTGSLRRVASDLDACIALAGLVWQQVIRRLSGAAQSAVADVRSGGDALVGASGDPSMLSTAGEKPRGHLRGRPPKAQDADASRWAETVR